MGRMEIAAAAATAALGLAAEPAADAPLKLRCDGAIHVLTESTSLHWLQRGGVSTTHRYGTRRDEDAVMFDMHDGAARVRLPAAMVTAVNSGGDVDGWWPVAELKVTDEMITGRLRVNIVNKPGLRIDRMTGRMDLGGAYPFRGQCERDTALERKF